MRPIPQVNVRIYQKKLGTITFEDYFLTNLHGKTIEIPLYAPDPSTSLDPLTEDASYELYHLDLRKPGFQSMTLENLRLFATHSTLSITMLPSKDDGEKKRIDVQPTSVDDPLYSRLLSHPEVLDFHTELPTRLHVESAETHLPMEVGFLAYFKYIASIWIYPTWPYEAQRLLLWLLSNRLLASLANTQDDTCLPLPAYQRYQVQHRLINDIIDTEFPSWLYAPTAHNKKPATIWEVIALASHGESAVAIGKRLFEEFAIQVAQEDPLQEEIGGALLKQVEHYLPFLQQRPEEEKLIAFQNQYDLKMSGHYHATTLQKLKQVVLYGSFLDQCSFLLEEVSDKQLVIMYLVFDQQCLLFTPELQETDDLMSYLSSTCDSLNLNTQELRDCYYRILSAWKTEPVLPPTLFSALTLFDQGEQVQQVQCMLNQLSPYYPSIPIVVCDGYYGKRVAYSVNCFQHVFHLPCTGIVDSLTWQTLYRSIHMIKKDDPSNNELPFYSLTPSTYTTNMMECKKLQTCLSAISKAYPSITTIDIDGVFGEQTHQAIIEVQRLLGLLGTGQLDSLTLTQVFQLHEELTEKKM